MLDTARWAVLVTAASLPFSSALMNLSTALAFVCWALSGQWRATVRTVAAEPAAWIGCALLAALWLGIAWSLAPASEAMAVINKYRELALFGIVMFLFTDARWRRRLLWVLFASTVALLLASYATYFGLVQLVDAGTLATQGAVVKKSSITHSFMMSVLAFAAAVLALRAQGGPRWAMGLIAALAALNVLIAVQGRTGYVVLVALLLWLAATRWSAKGVAVALAGAAIVLSAAYQWAPAFQARIGESVAEAKGYGSNPAESSIGQRLHYWKRSAESIIEHPLLGAGTGAWGRVFYESTVDDHPFFHDRKGNSHPHNEYLHLGVQLGIGGIALLAALFTVAFLRAGALPGAEAALARGVIIAFALACLFNDFLLDTTEGHLWAVLGGALFGASRALPRG